MIVAGTAQMATIEAKAYNQVAREMATEGVTLTHEQAAEIGDDAIDWLRTRLGLTVTTDDRGVTAMAREVSTDYWIVCRDSERPRKWMQAPGIVTMRPQNQEHGQCSWLVTTMAPDALETALDADRTVIRYEVR